MMDTHDNAIARLQKLERAYQAQKSFIHRVPDPDTRERAEAHLIQLVTMRDHARLECVTPS